MYVHVLMEIVFCAIINEHTIFFFVEDPQSLTYYAQGTNGMVTGVSGEAVVIAVFTGFGNLTSDDGVTCEAKSHPGIHNCIYSNGLLEGTYVCSVTAQEDRPYHIDHRGTTYEVQLTGEGGVCVCLEGSFVCLWCECVSSYFNTQMPLYTMHVHVCIVDCVSVCVVRPMYMYSFG